MQVKVWRVCNPSRWSNIMNTKLKHTGETDSNYSTTKTYISHEFWMKTYVHLSLKDRIYDNFYNYN